MEFGGTVSAGVSVKGMRSELLEEFEAWAGAADIGAQIRLSRALDLAVAARNLGTELRYRDDGMALPATLHGGAAYSLDLGDDGRLIVVGGGSLALYESEVVWRAGLEYTWRSMVAARAGVVIAEQEQIGAYSAGIGVVAGRYRLDYATSFDSPFDLPHLLNLTVSF